MPIQLSLPRSGWALVTGASAGIGEEIARALACRGFNIALVARRGDRLDKLAAQLRTECGVQTLALAEDLTDAKAPERVFAWVQSQGVVIDVLVNNAGVAAYGEFCRTPLAAQLSMVQLHCQAVVALTHLFAQGMVYRARGCILIVATTTLAPAPYITSYAATKGFDLLFAEGLAEELAHHGIGVSALCPGPTATELIVDTATQSSRHKLHSARDVAVRAVDGLLTGKRYIRPSFMDKVMANLPRFLPRATVSGALEAYYRPTSSPG